MKSLILCNSVIEHVLTTTTFALYKPTKNTEELRLQDMLVNMISPYIGEDFNNYYYPEVFGPLAS
ncbi:hypothetical protein FHS16_005187 [Paenibacillus endophyticus]|uniref:Uncharacterized protein n=1 Tax=Paenibacillus endophyticus TaxID=1294268 RepID=A0A7W5GCQ2_9BACL|nr:hypothetical protein [Paenibacillus endophyticus]